MCCRPAAERALTELPARGIPESHAVEAAPVIYRFRHPKISACTIVADGIRWTIGRTLH
jgi:hypothetical protein